MSKIYIFDMDGVLIDSMAKFERCMLRILDEHGIRYDEKMIDIVTPLGYQGTAEYYVNELGVNESVESIVGKLNKYLYEEYAHNIILKEGVMEYLQKLSSESARMFVLTASPHLMTDACLKHNEVFDMFEEVWSVDEFGGLTKSNIELFGIVADKVGCRPEEIHYFDDNVIAIENATKANYNTFAVRDRQTQKVWDSMKTTARHYVNSFREL